MFTTSDITSFFDYSLERCPNCSGQLQPRPDQDRILQQVELNENPLKKNQHKAYAYWYAHCKKIHYADFLPSVIKTGLFKTIHDRDSMNSFSFSTKLDACSKKIIAVATIDIPDDKDCKNMANRFLKHGNAYFQFITTPGIDPTNNIAEQALRFVVMYRHVSQGTRSENGRKACECFWSVIAPLCYSRTICFHLY